MLVKVRDASYLSLVLVGRSWSSVFSVQGPYLYILVGPLLQPSIMSIEKPRLRGIECWARTGHTPPRAESLGFLLAPGAAGGELGHKQRVKGHRTCEFLSSTEGCFPGKDRVGG